MMQLMLKFVSPVMMGTTLILLSVNHVVNIVWNVLSRSAPNVELILTTKVMVNVKNVMVTVLHVIPTILINVKAVKEVLLWLELNVKEFVLKIVFLVLIKFVKNARMGLH